MEFDKDKYSICHLYKWTTIIFQMAILYEFIIVPVFWALIFPNIIGTHKELIGDHS